MAGSSDSERVNLLELIRARDEKAWPITRASIELQLATTGSTAVARRSATGKKMSTPSRLCFAPKAGGR